MHAPRGPTVSRLSQTKAAVAILLGLSVLCGQADRDERDHACLEDLLQGLVGIFVKGGVRAPGVAQDQLLPDDVVRSAGADVADREARDGGWSVWRLADHLVGRVEAMLPPPGHVADDARPVRIRINITYLQALFASSSSTRATVCAHSTALFTECIRLGSLVGIHGALPQAPLSASAHDAHVSSLIWKSRKRLELSGHVDVALAGLPNGGQGFDRWSGGAAEKTRRAEEAQREAQARRKRRKDLARGRTPSQQRLYSLRIDDGVDDDGAEAEGEMLAPPLRLRGKRLAHCRKGSYEPSLCSPGSSSSTSLSTLGGGLPTPPASVSLRHPDCFFYHQSYTQSTPPSPGATPGPTSWPSLSACQDHSTTSLPSLERRQSIDLLRPAPPSPGRRLPPPSSFNAHTVAQSSPLKSPVPRPLPTLLDSQAIFAISPHSGGPVLALDSDDDSDAGEKTEPAATWLQAIRLKVSTLSLRSKASTVTLSATDVDVPPAAAAVRPEALVLELLPHPLFFPPSAAQSALASPTSPAPSLSTSLSSESTLATSPPAAPLNIPWRTVPAIGFTPSSHNATAASTAAAGDAAKGLRRGGILRSFSPVPSRLNANVRRRA